MISEHQEVARYRVAEQLRVAEARARLQEDRTRTSPREGLAGVLRRLADRLEPASRRLTEPATRWSLHGLREEVYAAAVLISTELGEAGSAAQIAETGRADVLNHVLTTPSGRRADLHDLELKGTNQ